MKPKNKIYPLLRMLAVALTAALLGPGCQKDFKWNEPLAVTQNGLNLTSAAGSTRVTVYSTGRWKAEMAEGAWGEVSEVSGNGIGDFLFTYEANNGVSRRARILVSGEGEEQEIVLTQTGAVTEPTLALAETEFEFVRLPRERVQIGVTTNMTQALECILITATDVTDAENPAEAGWLKEIRLEKDAEENIVLVFGIDRNDGSSDRKAAIPGLAVGCLITNLLSPYGLLDLVVGTLATLLAAVWSGRCRSAWTAAVPPVVCNMVLVGAMLAWESTGFSSAFAGLFAYNALTVGIGEAAVCFLLGVPLLRALEKRAIA